MCWKCFNEWLFLNRYQPGRVHTGKEVGRMSLLHRGGKGHVFAKRKSLSLEHPLKGFYHQEAVPVFFLESRLVFRQNTENHNWDCQAVQLKSNDKESWTKEKFHRSYLICASFPLCGLIKGGEHSPSSSSIYSHEWWWWEPGGEAATF